MNVEKVRENISLLISEIISLRKDKYSGYCVDVEVIKSGDCDGKCNECIKKHYENMEEYLNIKYNI